MNLYIKSITKIICTLLSITSCTTIDFKKEYETKFDILESHAKYISINAIKAENEYIYINLTNRSQEIVKINWQHTSLNSKNIVTIKDDIKLINNIEQYNNKYKEFFIGPETSQEFTLFLLGISNKNNQISSNKSEAHSYSFKQITYPAILKLNIVKANIDTNKTINILISKIPKSNS
ncbi:hypothetical protein F0310_04180 [Borrelia sp. A-FGy1]|uniref:hypothetical protein n=1 Tax=Borrelia sp. A-FGy1 TaxID=2608247 RepID=UPI0015F6105B|nr:hypothetical protein [Borrelia sp. A-FGy1]QMU99578.1 hypothetical protein F0310_04180 [Borrelia sp. A-FGy1]